MRRADRRESGRESGRALRGEAFAEVGKRVVGELASPLDEDESGASQAGEMTRDEGLTHPGELGEVADTEIAGREEIEEAEPGGIGAGLVERRDPPQGGA